MAPQRLLHLEAWSLVGGIALGRIRRYGLVGRGMSLGVGFKVSKAHAGNPSCLPSTCGLGVSSKLLLQCHSGWLLPCFLPGWSWIHPLKL